MTVSERKMLQHRNPREDGLFPIPQRNGSPTLELWDMTPAIITVPGKKPIARIRQTCAMGGATDRLDQAFRN
jgi:hypothetical protein